MEKANNSFKTTSREEDYRDYEARDLNDGWPYGDEDGISAKSNAPYGRTRSNFDEVDKVGAEIADQPYVESQGGPALNEDESRQLLDDNLESRIYEALDVDGRIDMALIDIKVNRGIATLSGKVETDYFRRLAEGAALSAKGVTKCHNELVVMGVDSELPDDDES